MIPTACGISEPEEKEVEQSALPQSDQHVTILMPVGDSSDVDQMATEDGAAADLPEMLGSAVAIDVPFDAAGVLEPIAGDTTEDTTGEELLAFTLDGQLLGVDNRLAQAEALPAELRDDNGDEETRTVDFGWDIVVGELTLQSFGEIMSLPKL